MAKIKKYKMGVDNAFSGCVVITEDNKLIDICMYPKKLKHNNKLLAELKKEKKNENYLYFSKRYDKKFIKYGTTLDKRIKAEIKDIIFKTGRDYTLLHDFFNKYALNCMTCTLEKPILQSSMATNIYALSAGLITLEIYIYLLTIHNIPYSIPSVSEWRSNYNYKTISQEELDKYPKDKWHVKRKEFDKQESIRLAEEHVIDIKKFYIPSGSRNISHDICEASLISIIGD